MPARLNHDERLQLMRFVCSFAWADLEVSAEERDYVAKAIRGLKLDPEEARTVHGWLDVPPAIDDIDPTQVPHEHRRMFLDAIGQVIVADGKVRPEEIENLELFKQLLA